VSVDTAAKYLVAVHGMRRERAEETVKQILLRARPDRDAISTAVGRVLFNSSNYPEAVQVRILGQDTSVLRGLIVNAVMDVLGENE
jgi:nanoRNase/pAp phosphatase (c-di-AMP/oligoRNAs hydrolase)